MDAISYGDLRIEMLEQGGKIERAAQRHIPGAQAAPWPPGREEFPGRQAPAPLGRDAQIDAALAATAAEPVEFHAACGFGKSTLLQHVAAQMRSGAGTPVAYLRVGGYHAGDLRQRLTETLYPTGTPFKPTPVQLGQLMRQARATILLDDLGLDASELAELLDEIPGCTVIVGSGRPVLPGRGRSIPLTGLPLAAALELLRNDLGRDLIDGERADAERLWDAVEGQPLHLRQAAALVREGRHSFAELANTAEHDTFALDRLSVNALTGPQRKALALLAFAAGALLPAELIGNVTGAAETWGLLTSMRARGLAEQDKDQFGLPSCHAEDYRALLMRSLELGDAVRVLVNWVRQRGPGSDDARDAADAALSLIGYAAERAEWPAVVRLVEVIEPVLSLSGRWDAWISVLGRGLSAARTAGNLAAQAHMSHQLGVHQFALGELQRAREYWDTALHLREELNDVAGAALTRANMELLPPAQPATHRLPRQRARRHVLSKSASTWAAVAGTAVVALGLPLAHSALHNRSTARTTAGSTPSVAASSPNTATDPAHNGTKHGNNGQGGNTGGNTGGFPGGGNQGGTTTQDHGTGPTTVRASARVSVSPASYSGTTCPAIFTFTGRIDVSAGPATVTYQWIRSDGATAPSQTISFTGTGPQHQSVSSTWTLSTDGNSWEAIQIISPGSATSNKAAFSLTCQPSITATASVSPTSYTGFNCPVVFTFTGDIQVASGPATVTYKWIRSDGAIAPSQTISFTGSGPQDQTVSTTWTLSANGTNWEAIQITSPGSVTSNKATFTLDCQSLQ